MSDQAVPAAEAPAAAVRPVRPLYWSIRRELWENPSIYIAPLAVAGLALLGFLVSSLHLAETLRHALAAIAAAHAAPGDALAEKTAARAQAVFAQPYAFATGVVFATSEVVTFFYALSSLYAERRDRSILFWKSLPVSDLTTVLSKAAVAFLGTPIVVMALSIATSLFVLIWSSVVILAGGGDLGGYLGLIPIPFMWIAEARGLLAMVLWYAPIIAWLIVVSGWARRVAILWALGPWAALCIFELLAFHTTYAWTFIRHRLAGGYELGFTTNGHTQVEHIGDLDLTPILANLEVWAGVIVAVGLLAAAVRMRRYRDPI